ncbi:MAG: hypothetical protein ACYCU8_00220 [Ferrimicrobium acidiphilum]
MSAKLYTPDLKTPIAEAASVALAIMGAYGVATWDEVDVDALSYATYSRVEGFDMMLAVLRYPTKIEKKRSLTPCISIAVCTKCGGWYTIQLRKNNKLGGVLGVPDTEREKLKCVVTTGCTGEIEVATPATVEGSTKSLHKESE